MPTTLDNRVSEHGEGILVIEITRTTLLTPVNIVENVFMRQGLAKAQPTLAISDVP
jgi:hypothetical protein